MDNEDSVALLNETKASVTSNAKRGAIAFELEKEIIELQKKIGYNFIEMGKALKDVRDNQYYLELGHTTLTDWLQERSINPSWAWNFISIYEIFILEHKLSPERVLETDYNKLSLIVPIVRKHPEQVDDWLEKATTLRRIDLKREIMEFRQIEEPDRNIAADEVAHIKVSDLIELLHYALAIVQMDKEGQRVNEQAEYLVKQITGMIKKTGITDENKLIDQSEINKIRGQIV